MPERIFILGILITLIIIFQKRFKSGKIRKSLRLPENIRIMDPTLPTVLYFQTDTCVQCRTSQKPVLNNLKKRKNNFNLIEVNAFKEKELTSLFNIRTVPSTVIFSNDGSSKFINNGFAGRNELLKQLEEVKN